MIENNYGYIINIDSVMAFAGYEYIGAYCSSKAAALNFCETLRAELRRQDKRGVSVTAICPTHMKTRMFSMLNDPSLRIPSVTAERVAKETVVAAYDRQFLVLVPSYLNISCILKL